MPIPRPILETRDENRLAAEAIGKTSGGITVERVKAQIAERQELLKLLEGGNLPPTPICPELTNANPSSAHTVLLEAMAGLLSDQAYRFNQIPDQNAVAFHNLFGIELRPAKQAETSIRFTASAGPGGLTINIPAGTAVSDSSGAFIFETVSAAVVTPGNSVNVLARRTVTGHILLAPDTLTTMIDQIAFIASVTNPSSVDSGAELETVESALERARLFQRRGKRIVSDHDLESAILDEVLGGSGFVRVFPLVRNGQFDSDPALGHTTVVVMTRNGFPVDDAAKQKITELFDQLPGNMYAYIVDPVNREFNISVKVRINGSTPQSAVTKAVEDNLRAFYAPSRQQFGRKIFQSEIISIVENTAGVDHIVAEGAGVILAAPTADIGTKVWECPELVTCTVTVVN